METGPWRRGWRWYAPGAVARGNAGANSTPLCERVALESKALAANISAGINRDFSLGINSHGFLSWDYTRCMGIRKERGTWLKYQFHAYVIPPLEYMRNSRLNFKLYVYNIPRYFPLSTFKRTVKVERKTRQLRRKVHFLTINHHVLFRRPSFFHVDLHGGTAISRRAFDASSFECLRGPTIPRERWILKRALRRNMGNLWAYANKRSIAWCSSSVIF